MCQSEVDSVTNGDVDSDFEQVMLQGDESSYHGDLSVDKISNPNAERLAQYQGLFHWKE